MCFLEVRVQQTKNLLAHGEELLSSLQTYLQLRGSTIQSRPDETKGQSAETQSSRDTDLTMLVTTPVEEEAPRLLRRSSTRSPAKNGSRSPSKPQTRPRSPIPAPPSEPLSPRQRNAQLLTKVAQLSEDLVRAGNEKINVARYANDIVRTVQYRHTLPLIHEAGEPAYQRSGARY